MIIFAAITPHPPILIPTIGKKNLNKIKNTVKAMEDLEMELYASKPDIIFIISSHGLMHTNRLSANLFPQYESNFEEFGDYSTKQTYKGCPHFIEQMRMSLESEGVMSLYSEQKLDHGTSVPLYYLTKHLKNVKIVPVGIAESDYEIHYQFGQRIKRELFHRNERIAIIASGDLSHRLTKDAPAGYSPSGQKFDNHLIELIKEKNIHGILKMNKKMIHEAGECGLRGIMALLGIIENINFEPEVLSYEGPFGVGYMVCNFRIK